MRLQWRLLFTVIVLVLLSPVWGRICASEEQDALYSEISDNPYFFLEADTSENDYLLCQLLRPDGSIIVGGYSTTSTGDFGVLMKYDSFGNKIWGKRGDRSTHGFYESLRSVEGIDETDDGGFIIIGIGGIYHNRDILIAKFDLNDDLVWARKYCGYATQNDDGSIIACPDGGYIAGGTISVYSEESHLWFGKIDSLGNEIWFKTIDGETNDYCHTIVPSPGGGFAVTGGTTTNTNEIETLRFDSAGNLLWIRTLGGPSHDEGYDLCNTPDGGVLVSGIIRDLGQGEDDFLLAKYSVNGDLESAYSIGTPMYEGCVSIADSRDGGYILGGYKGLVIKMDSELNILWANELDASEDFEILYSIDTSPNGDITWAGYSVPSSNLLHRKHLLGKTNADGLLNNCPYIQPVSESIIKTDITDTVTTTAPTPAIENLIMMIEDVTEDFKLRNLSPTIDLLCYDGPAVTPTPVPTTTPTPTNTPGPTVSPSPTPVAGVSVKIDCPQLPIHSGSTFYLDIVIDNSNKFFFSEIPLFCILEAAGTFFYYPAWTSLPTWETLSVINPGNTRLSIFPAFQWPDNVGSGSVVIWGALTDPQMSEILGEIDTKTLSWE